MHAATCLHNSIADLTMAGRAAKSDVALRVAYHEKSVPLAVLAISELSQFPINAQADSKFSSSAQPVAYISSKESLVGRNAIVRYLARSAQNGQLAGPTVLSSVQVDHWLEFSNLLVNGVGLEAACTSMNDYLALRTYLAGHQLTAADVACWAQLQGAMQWEGLQKSGKFPHLVRWLENVNRVPELKALAEKHGPRRRRPELTSKQTSKSCNKGTTDASFDIGLGPEWQGKVVTRFPPEPSGFLHVGHAKALILNQQIALANRGRMLVRFDDTNPDKEKDVYVESILEDMKRLGAEADKVTYTSNYFPEMLDLAERLIKAGHLYADDTLQEKMREERMAKQPSQRRDRSIEDNLRIWKEMVAGSKEGFQNCLRFKLDPASDNGTLRDPVAYRCNDTPHLHTGTKYKVYPTYDCACPFVDALEGVTHALRTSEYRDREEQFYRILKMQQEVWPGLGNVAVWDYSRLSFVNTVLSKRKLTKLVNMGAVEGWDDPRMPTVQGLLRRGLQVEALRDFILAQGASKNVTYQEWDKIWTFNKKVIDPVCPRHTAVKTEGRVLLRFSNVAETDFVTVDRHKKHPPAGKKTTMRSPEVWLDQEDASLLHENEEVTLMDWGNAIIRKIHKSSTGEVTGLEGETHLEGAVGSTKWKLTWLADSPEMIPLTLVSFDHLITKKKLEEDDEIEDLVNPCSRWETEAVGDCNMRVLQKGDIIQLERRGYFSVDRPFVRKGKPMVLLSIPDGRSKSIAAKPATAVQQKAASASEPAAGAAKTQAKSEVNGQAKVKAAKRKPSLSTADTPVTSKIAIPAASTAQPSSLQTSAKSDSQHAAERSGNSEAAQLRPSQQPSGPAAPSTPPNAVSSSHSTASRPIPVPSRLSDSGSSLRGSVPPTPANTPQAGLQIPPPKGKGIAELDALVELPKHLSRSSTKGSTSSVPPTPNNTPQASVELPRRVGGALQYPASPLQPKQPDPSI